MGGERQLHLHELMAELDDAQKKFVQEELEAFSTYFLEQAKARILRRHIQVDDVLLNSLATEVLDEEFRLKFVDHGRFHDMGAGRGYHKGKFMGAEERGLYLKGRKASKWYSRLAWGAVYGTLVNNLANKYIKEAPTLLVAEYNKT